MARSLKKDLFVDAYLLEKIEALGGKNKLLKHGLEDQLYSLNLLDILLQYITGKNTSLYMLLKKW